MTDTANSWWQTFLSEHGITWEIGPPVSHDQHGNAYVELFLAGPKEDPEKDFLTTVASSEELCKSTYLNVLHSYLNGRKRIVWRIEPETYQDKEKDRGFYPQWRVYSRLTVYAS